MTALKRAVRLIRESIGPMCTTHPVECAQALMMSTAAVTVGQLRPGLDLEELGQIISEMSAKGMDAMLDEVPPPPSMGGSSNGQ